MDYNITFRKKDKSLQCIISYKDENGKWKQKSKQGFKAQKDAKSWISDTVDDLKEEIELNIKIDPELKGLTFKELKDKYIKHKSLYLSTNTITSTKTAVSKFEYLSNMIVTDIAKSDIQHCVDEMVKSKLAPSSIKSYLSKVISIFNYAIHDIEIIKDNPCDKITVLDKKKDKKIRALTKSQLDNLLAKIDGPHQLISMLAGTCGLRLGEILGLTWDDIDINKGNISVNKQWKVVNGFTYNFGDVKSKNSVRNIPIPPATLKAIKKYKKLYPIHTNKRLFYQFESNPNVGYRLASKFKALGYDISIHDLRHTYATHLIANGLNFKSVAMLMGHDVQETIKTYSHVTDDMIKDATNLIENIF